MSRITVLSPHASAAPSPPVALAVRRGLPDHTRLGLIANGKPLATELLGVLADAVEAKLGGGVSTTLLRKPSAAYPITTVQADEMAARAHLVITGVGD